MQDILSKIGIPTAIGTAISLVVVVTPMLFKIDERYAKQEALEAEVQKLEKQNAELRAELAQAAGFQQAMVAFIQQGRLPRPAEPAQPAATAAPAPIEVPPARVFAPAPQPAPAIPRIEASGPIEVPASNAGVVEAPRNWKELNEGLTRQQRRLSEK